MSPTTRLQITSQGQGERWLRQGVAGCLEGQEGVRRLSRVGVADVWGPRVQNWTKGPEGRHSLDLWRPPRVSCPA